MQRDMDLLTRRLWGPAESRKTWVPAVDVFHRGGDLVIRAELPGIDPENDVEITLRDGLLTIRGERRHEERTSENGMSRFESAFGSFERSVVLPQGVKEDDITAGYENGILEVVIPGVAELTGEKRIPVKAGSGRTAITTNATTGS
jgi:HSP20 family protein